MQIGFGEADSFTTMHNSSHTIAKIFLAIYMIVFLIQTLFHPFTHIIPQSNSSILDFVTTATNLHPFSTIIEATNYFLERKQVYYLWPLFYNTFVLVLPTILIQYLYKFRGKSLFYFYIVTLSILGSLYFCRLLLKRGAFDIDDILLNMIGWGIGVVISYVLQSIITKTDFHSRKTTSSIK